MNPLLNQWLTLQNQGQNLVDSSGDASPQYATDWLHLFAGATDQFDTARGLGYSGAMPVEQRDGDATTYQPGNPQQELFDWMQSSGYGYGINPTFNGGQINTWLDPQGQEVAGTRREFAAPDDREFGIAASLAAAAGGGMMGAGWGGVAQGAMAGGSAAGINDASLESIAKGAVIGGITGGLKDYAGGFQPMPETGLSPMEFNPDDLFKGMADPTAALQPLEGIGAMPGAMPGMNPGGLYAPMGDDIAQGLQNLRLPEVPSLPWQPTAVDPYAQTVEITAPKSEPIPTMDAPTFEPDSLFKGMADPTKALQPLPDMAPMPGAMPGGNPLMDWIKGNPKLAARLFTAAGGLMGGAGANTGGGGGQTVSGPAKQWTSALQMGGQSQPWKPTMNNPAAIQARSPYGAGRYFGGT